MRPKTLLIFTIIVLAALLAVGLTFFPRYTPKVGDTLEKRGWSSSDWVKVRNLTRVTAPNGYTFDFGDQCLPMYGLMTVVGQDSRANMLLVRWTRNDLNDERGCPTGVLFFTSNKKFIEDVIEDVKNRRAFEAREKAKREEEARLRSVVERIIKEGK